MSRLCEKCQAEKATNDPVLLTISEVAEIVPLCKRTLQRMVKAESFPQPVRLGHRATFFLESEVRDWLSEKIASRQISGSDYG